MDSSLHSGLNWLMKSGIQHPTGAVFGEYNSLTTSYDRVSTRAAAASIQAVLQLGDPPDQERKEAAIAAGRYLMERSFDMQSDLFLDDPTVDDRRCSFAGSTAALRALNALWRTTRDSAYSECADRCARSILVKLPRVDGSFFTNFDPAENRAIGDQAGPEQLKAAAAFLELAEDGGLAELRRASEQLFKFALARHEALLAALPEEPAGRLDYLRRYALFLEGLLPFAAESLEAGSTLQRGIIRIEAEAEKIDADKLPPELLAQPLRLRLLADLLGLGELDRAQSQKEADRLAEYQLQSSDPSLDGAFAPVRTPTEVGVALSASPTVVALQALEFWEEANSGAFRRGWRDLI